MVTQLLQKPIEPGVSTLGERGLLPASIQKTCSIPRELPDCLKIYGAIRTDKRAAISPWRQGLPNLKLAAWYLFQTRYDVADLRISGGSCVLKPRFGSRLEWARQQPLRSRTPGSRKPLDLTSIPSPTSGARAPGVRKGHTHLVRRCRAR